MAATDAELLEYQLLTMPNEQFSAWLSATEGSRIRLADMVEDEVVRSLEIELNESTDGVPESWKTEEARWLDQEIQSKLRSLSTRAI